MPADAAGQVLPQGLPRALPGARDPTALAAALRVGDITRPGRLMFSCIITVTDGNEQSVIS